MKKKNIAVNKESRPSDRSGKTLRKFRNIFDGKNSSKPKILNGLRIVWKNFILEISYFSFKLGFFLSTDFYSNRILFRQVFTTDNSYKLTRDTIVYKFVGRPTIIIIVSNLYIVF